MKYIKKSTFIILLSIISSVLLPACYDILIGELPRLNLINLNSIEYYGPLSVYSISSEDKSETGVTAKVDVIDILSSTTVYTTNVNIKDIGVYKDGIKQLSAGKRYRVKLTYLPGPAEAEIIKTIEFDAPQFNSILFTTTTTAISLQEFKFATKVDQGSLKTTTYGHVWSTENIAPIPSSTANKKEYPSNAANTFESTFTFPAGQMCYVWAYATDGVSIDYSATIYVESTSPNQFSVTTIDPVTAIGSTWATISGQINVTAGTVNRYGVVVSSVNPTPSININEFEFKEETNGSPGNLVFPKTFNTLKTGTIYYARVFAASADGITRYGTTITFTPSLINDKITITQPTTGAIFKTGTTMPITWSQSSNFPVSIELYNGTNKDSSIAPGITGNQYDWSILSNFPTGTNYRIRVFKTDSPNVESYSFDFTIQ